MDALIANARFHFHKQLFETNTLTLTTAGVASNADTSSRGSKAIARRIVDILVEEQHHAVSTVDKISGQTLGKQFETLTMEFLRETFPYLQNLRPGNWTILQLGNNNKLKTSDFAQYEHLAYLNALTTQNAQLAAALGNDYLVAPDVVVYRDLYEDSEINAAQPIVDDEICKMADIRKSNGGKPILHASVSAKYTMRSDRAQNSRTEALNLIRNRKGHLPHIVVVTAEPMPNRLASLALGTGDIDCVYHFALYELIRAVKEAGSEDGNAGNLGAGQAAEGYFRSPTGFVCVMADSVSSVRRSEIMSHIKSKDTSIELLVRRKLFSMGYRYRVNYKALPGKPDIVFTRKKIAIFIHGCYWHGHDCGSHYAHASQSDKG